MRQYVQVYRQKSGGSDKEILKINKFKDDFVKFYKKNFASDERNVYVG